MHGRSVILICAMAAALPVAAEAPPPFPVFSAKRIAAPAAASTAPRITIRIEAPPPQAQPPAGVPEPGDAAEGGFWADVSPHLEDGSSGRLEEVLAALDRAGAGQGPRLDDMRRITDAHGRDILRLSIGTRVSPALVAAVIAVESSGRSAAVSSAGATGLMQLMPATAARFGVLDRMQPAENIRGGIAYLDWLLREFDLDPVLALAGYNAGENAVKLHGGVPPFSETRAYVPKVLSAWRVAAGLCRTPPMLVTDGCVFVGPDA